jgi:hypothetical protein
MPYIIRKVRSKDCFTVTNKITKKIHARCTTREKAEKQVKLLRAVDHGFKPKKKRHMGKNN